MKVNTSNIILVLKIIFKIIAEFFKRVSFEDKNIPSNTYDPDFDLTEGSHQLALLWVLIRMIFVKEIIYTILNPYRIFKRIQSRIAGEY